MKIRKRILSVVSALLISVSAVYPVNITAADINGETLLSEQAVNEEKIEE